MSLSLIMRITYVNIGNLNPSAMATTTSRMASARENGYGADCYLHRDHPTNVVVSNKANNWRQMWKLEQSGAYHYFKNGLNPENGYGADCYLHRDHPTNVVVSNKANNWRQMWKLESTGVVANNNIANALSRWQGRLPALEAARKELAEKEAILNASTRRTGTVASTIGYNY